MNRFIHLHTHSHYSLLDGLSNIGEMVELAKSYDMPALALTDHGALYGAIEFYKKCKKADIKPIIGLEAYIASGSRFDKQPGIDNKRYHLTLLAKNAVGYKNLVKLVSASHLEGFYYKPRIDKEILRECSEGLIALSGCFGGELSKALRNKDIEKAEKVIHEHQEIFGKDNYFLEVMHHPGIEGHEEVRSMIVGLSKKWNIPLVATQDSHYLLHTDVKAHETLLAVQQNTDLDDTKRLSLSGDDFSFINTETAQDYFKEMPEAIANTECIAEMCNVELSLGNWIFPDYALPTGVTADEELRSLVYKGLGFRNVPKTEEVKKRIEYELKIISEKKFSPYLLVVGDLLRYARENKILTNTRGSAAGSFASYLLGISNVNPIEFKLPFERFLNPERPSAPDIDMDFADNRRDEVIQYAKRKYGEDRVAQVGTFGTMMARGAVRDVARALGHPYSVGDGIAKLIPVGSQGFPMTIDHALDSTPELNELYKKDSVSTEVIDLARRLEGTARHVSIHAAGVVISPRPLSDLVPLQYDPSGERIITQYDMYAIDDIGLLKLDFLGIKNLTILGDAVELVKKCRGEVIDIDTLTLEDKKTFAMLARGETLGLFQLNGQGMTRYLKELKPTTIHDINAMIALYRPGPMAFIPDYIKRKENPSLITYLDPRLEEILKETYGILIYQDDILLITTQLAGYSWGEADKFRKAVGKKIPEEMQAQKEHFSKGCIEGGMSEEKTKKLWEMIETFAAYGFNKAHSASYGRVAYQTAFMKANYGVEYMAAVLTSDAGEVEKIAENIRECKRMGIPVLPPDVNESFGTFTVVKAGSQNQIRFGLFSVKNFGEEIAQAIINERESRGKFPSFSNFLERVQHKNLNRKSLEALIRSGAMDSFGERGALFATVEEALAYNRNQNTAPQGQNSLFGLMQNQSSIPKFRLKEVEPLSKDQKLLWEKELLGLYISGHPLEKHKERLEKLGVTIQKIKKYQEGVTTPIGGIIQDVRTILTSKGDKMAFIKVADLTDTIECVVFPRSFKEYESILKSDKTVLVKGKVSHRNGVPSLIVEKMKELE